MKYMFLINPLAGSGKGRQVWRQLALLLDEQRVDYEKVTSTRLGHPRQLARQVAQTRPDINCLVVVGGDGTLHEAIAGLLSNRRTSTLPVAYVPAGTGNDFARGYGISTRPRQALRQILENNCRHVINVGRFYDHASQKQGIFLNNLGIGFDAAIVHATNHSRAKDFLNHHHLGTFSYIVKAVRVLFTQPIFRVQVNVAGSGEQVFDRAFLLIASNHPFIGGGIRVAPDQRVDQQQLELVVLAKAGRLSIIRSIILFACGRLPGSRHTQVFRGTKLRYHLSPAQYGQVDGEELGRHAFELDLSCTSYPVWQQPH